MKSYVFALLFALALPVIALSQSPEFQYPLEQEYKVTCRYGKMYHMMERSHILHPGIDYGAPTGTPVLASADGVVDDLRYNAPGTGNMVQIAHDSVYSSRYLHLSRINVKPGQVVKAGDVIGHVGMTGKASGPHLHLEIRENGKPVDPTKFLSKREEELTAKSEDSLEP